MSQWDSFPRLHKPTPSGLSLGENGGPMVQSHQQPHVGRGTFVSGLWLSVAPAHPQGACGARGGAAARPCLWEAVATPLEGPAPCTPLSKTPSTLQRAPRPGRGLNPQVPPCKEWQCWSRGDATGSLLELSGVFLVMLERLQGAGAEAGAVLGIATGASHSPTGRPSPASSCPPLAKLLG